MKKTKSKIKSRAKNKEVENNFKSKLIGFVLIVFAISLAYGAFYVVTNNSNNRTNVSSSVKNPILNQSATTLLNHCAGVCNQVATKPGDMVISYNGDIMVSGEGEWDGNVFPKTKDKSVNIPAGKYTVKLESYDNFVGREDNPVSEQSHEQYYVIFKKGNKELDKSGTTKDLKDGVEEAGNITFVNKEDNPINLSSDADKITIVHAGPSSQIMKHGFEPVCMLLERIKDKPKCGDGNVDKGEECDDGNTTNGDGCSAKCKNEAKPINGKCGVAKNTCKHGSFKDIADTNTFYKWKCEGQNGGTDVNCKKPIPPTPVNGECGLTVNQCKLGSFKDIADTNTFYKWKCEGQNGGTDVNCKKPIPPTPVNGECGLAKDVCKEGSYNNLDDSTSKYKWECKGLNGGDDIRCSIDKPVVPVKENKDEKEDCNSSIGNYIWYDTNGNGVQEDIEEGIEGIKVCAYRGNKKHCDTTNKHGKYKIKDLCKGTYDVRVKGVDQMTQTFDPDGKKDNKTKVRLKNNDKHTKADFGYRGKAPSTGLATNIALLIGISTLITIGILMIMRKKGAL